MSQEPCFFERPLLENLCYGSPQSTLEDVRKAVKSVQAEEFIAELPQGYQTIIGDKGVTLSGGQRQRLSLVRVLLKKAPILILDEATSQMDVLLEKKIQTILQDFMKNRTTLLISHRLSLMKNMDRVIDLKAAADFAQNTINDT